MRSDARGRPITGTQCELLYSLAAPVTKNTYTTQACMSALAASAAVSDLREGSSRKTRNPLGRTLLLSAAGTIATTSAATLSPAIALDTTAGTALNPVTIYSTVAPTAAVTAQWDLQAIITCQAFGETAGMTSP